MAKIKKKIELTERDLREILANKYGLNPDTVLD